MTASRWLLLVVACSSLTAGCGRQDSLGSDAEGYAHSAEQLPHPGIAEGRPVVTLPKRGTFYACPPLQLGDATPLITDPCLTPGDAATTRFDEYSLLQPSVACADGRRVTDAGLLGVGFVGEPLVPPSGPQSSSAVRRCLSAAEAGG